MMNESIRLVLEFPNVMRNLDYVFPAILIFTVLYQFSDQNSAT